LLGLILLVLTLPDKRERHLVTVREMLTLSYAPIVQQAQRMVEKAHRAAAAKGRASSASVTDFSLDLLLRAMIALGTRYGGIASAIGSRFLNMNPQERSSVMSTASVHTDFLDSEPMRAVIRHSTFSLKELRSDTPTCMYFVLPVREMERQFRMLRLIVQMACTTLERFGPYPRDRPSVLFMMEEFAILGRLDIRQRAAAYLPGFGVKLWIVLQGLQQLIDHYGAGHHTFMGNAGLIQMFAPDDPALQYASARVGKLMEPWEMRLAFSRKKNTQLRLMEGEPPAAATRLKHTDVDLIRARMKEWLDQR
jgi:type IV secretion system protein VirD4